MNATDPLDAVRAAAEALRAAEAASADAAAARDAAVVRAVEQGVTMRTVATAAGLTYGRVGQIVKKHRRYEQGRPEVGTTREGEFK